jgi:hypothetical protein
MPSPKTLIGFLLIFAPWLFHSFAICAADEITISGRPF